LTPLSRRAANDNNQSIEDFGQRAAYGNNQSIEDFGRRERRTQDTKNIEEFVASRA